MVIVNCSLMHNDLINVVQEIEVNNVKPFKFIEKQGMKLSFETGEVNKDEACVIVKNAIKKSPLGALLYFSVAAE